MVWNANITMSAYCLKVMVAFKKSEMTCIPNAFVDHVNSQLPREEYEEKIKSGEMMGGGIKAWKATLDHIIMALEYDAIRDARKYGEWFVRHFGMDPKDKTNKCNEYVSYEYRKIDRPKCVTNTSSSQKPDPSEVEWCKEIRGYYNVELVMYAEDCVQYGLELLGRFWTQMCD